MGRARRRKCVKGSFFAKIDKEISENALPSDIAQIDYGPVDIITDYLVRISAAYASRGLFSV